MQVSCWKLTKGKAPLIVQVDDKFVLYTMESASELEHAYAITVHKSQGNEFPAVRLCLCFREPPQLFYRNLLHAGVATVRKIW